MGFFDLLNDAIDSAENSKKAREYRKRAQDIVDQGERIYDKAYDKARECASKTESKLRQHTEYKKQLAKKLGGEVGSTLKNFERFDIDARTISAPEIGNVDLELRGFSSAVSNVISPIPMPSIFDMFCSDDDYYEAKRQYDEAKRYKERMKNERDKLDHYRENMYEICSFIDSERRELDSLMSKLEKMTEELKQGMKKSSFNIEEAEYLKGIHKISQCIVTLLSENFLGDKLSISQRYRKIFSAIENINHSLPSAPSITDESTVLAIKHIRDTVIVY